MNIKTITTTDGVNEVDFGSGANRYYWFRNIGTTALYVSGNADISADADGVAELAAGGSVCIETLGGKVYILGEGTVEIHNTGDKFCPFKLAPAQNGGGGSAVDAYTKAESDGRYPLKTDAVPRGLGFGYGYCSTAAATAAKTATIAGTDSPKFVNRDGGIAVIKFTNAVGAMSTLNINNSGAMSIFYHNTNITDGVINAGDTVTFMKMGSIYHIVSIENNGNAKTVNGHTVNADVPENAVFTDTVPDMSGYMKKNETITIGNVFTPFPRQVDTNGKIVYSEYTRKNSDGTADKLFRIMGDPDAPSYSDFQAHYDGQNVIWYFNGTGLGVSAKIGGRTVITEATAALQEFGGTPKLSDGVKTDVAVSFNPKIVLLFNSGRIITGGYSIAMGTKKFTVTPSAVATMGTATPGYIAFG